MCRMFIFMLQTKGAASPVGFGVLAGATTAPWIHADSCSSQEILEFGQKLNLALFRLGWWLLFDLVMLLDSSMTNHSVLCLIDCSFVTMHKDRLSLCFDIQLWTDSPSASSILITHKTLPCDGGLLNCAARLFMRTCRIFGLMRKNYWKFPDWLVAKIRSKALHVKLFVIGYNFPSDTQASHGSHLSGEMSTSTPKDKTL